MRFEAGIANCEIKDINNLLHFLWKRNKIAAFISQSEELSYDIFQTFYS